MQKVKKKEAKSRSGSSKPKKASSQEETSFEWEIPSNLEPLFDTFHQFIKDVYDEPQEEPEETNQQQYQQQVMEMDPETRQMLELRYFVESLETEDDRNIWMYLIRQNITDPTTIRALMIQLREQARAQQKEMEETNPEQEIERTRKAYENLNALNQENLQNNLNYSMPAEPQNNANIQQMLSEVSVWNIYFSL